MYNKLERKFGRYAVSNLTIYIIFTYILGYCVLMFAPNILMYLPLDMSMVLKGQVWRLISWILIPPESLGIFTILTLFFYYWVGKSLENTIGDFAYNLFIFGGILISEIASVLAYLIPELFGGNGYIFTPSTYYLCLSVFLIFALHFPDMEIRISFILPVKIKWLAILDAAYLILLFITGDGGIRIMILANIANLLIYYFCGQKGQHLRPSQVKRRAKFKAQVKQHTSITRHRCAVCGRTERDGDLTFRYCSKCNGNFEYCSDHIYTHEHVK